MTMVRWISALALLTAASTLARADDLSVGGTVLTTPPAATVTPAKPGAPAPLIGLDSSARALVPPGSSAAARNDGLAGSPQASVDLSYVPPAERDSYFNSHDYADHLQTSTRAGHHPSALSQLGGAGEAMAINGAIMGIEGLTLGMH